MCAYISAGIFHKKKEEEEFAFLGCLFAVFNNSRRIVALVFFVHRHRCSPMISSVLLRLAQMTYVILFPLPSS